MFTNIFICFAALLLATLILAKQFSISRNILLLFVAQPLAMCSSPVLIFIGGILANNLVDDSSLVTLPVTLMILGVACSAIPAALLAKRLGRKLASLFGFSISLLAAGWLAG